MNQKFTGKERDVESGLDYFGARYFSDAQSRFTSPDPKSAGADMLNPQSWNGFSYALNNPLRYIDRHGKWPTDIHNVILNAAFNRLSNAQVAVLQSASESVDSFWRGGQTAALAYQHGMRSPYETAAHARADADQFILSNERAAATEAAKAGSVNDAALNDLGRALHTIMDRTSPSHAGEQVWTGGGEPGLTSAAGPTGFVVGVVIDAIRAKIHSDKEKQITLDQYHKAVDAARTEYLKTFGQDAYYRATGCKQVKECEYDDSQLPDKLRKE